MRLYLPLGESMSYICREVFFLYICTLVLVLWGSCCCCFPRGRIQRYTTYIRTATEQVRPKQPSEDWVSSLWDYICKSGGGGGRGRAERDTAETVRLFERSWPLLPATGGVGSDKIRVLLELHPGMPVVSPLSEGLGSREMSTSMVKVRATAVLQCVDASGLGSEKEEEGVGIRLR